MIADAPAPLFGPRVGLGSLPGSSSTSTAYGISGDGQLIVGDSGSKAFVWDSMNGMRDLTSVLTDTLGLNLSGWSLSTASAISTDGSTIVGWGTDPSGEQEAWIAVVPEPASCLLVMFGLAAILARRLLRGCEGAP